MSTWLWLLLAASATSAYAAEPDADRIEAQRLCTRGDELYQQGQFDAALEQFQRAYELFPSANVRYDIGVVLYELHRDAEAAAAFDEFLASAPLAQPDARAFAASRLATLEPRIARLDLAVVPADAQVTIDGHAVHASAAPAIPLAPGVRIVEAAKPGYVAARVRVALSAGERRRLELPLSVEPAVEAVARVPADARASITTSVPARATPAQRPPLYRRWWLWTGVGAAATGLGLGLGLGLSHANVPIFPPVRY